MTAPKPKVWMEHIPATTIMLDGKYPISLDAKWWPKWSCDCEPGRTRTGGRQWMGDDRPDIERAIEVATAHSRTHTAERIADELARLEQGASTFAELLAGSDLESIGYHNGAGKAYAVAADLIREHLT